MNLKGERVASDMQRELGNILLLEAKDEDFKHVTITDCDVTNDLSFAKIYFTTTDDREKVEKDLNNAAGFFRSLLAERLQIRHTPELRFIFDESIEYGQKIEKIIEKLHEEENNK
ncbi:MAG: 30S ribosome-binding factor RbfA [Bacilli bacterium]|jgi:ribosome-binding factor A|nr:30S ribosome-binding factor RbfA [Bacilli bacterium]